MKGMQPPKGGAYGVKSVKPSRVASDPKMRDDRLCVRVDCRRPLPAVAVRHEDPFCSTTCCRAWYDVEVEPLAARGRRQR